MPDLTAIPMGVLWGLSGLSLLMFFGSLLALRFVIVHMPADYFVREEKHGGGWLGDSPPMRLVAMLLKNGLGLVLLALGLIMLFTPGQGVLLILIGVSLLDVPGKRAIQLRLVGNPTVLRTINRIRAKAGRPPIDLGAAGNRRKQRAPRSAARSES